MFVNVPRVCVEQAVGPSMPNKRGDAASAMGGERGQPLSDVKRDGLVPYLVFCPEKMSEKTVEIDLDLGLGSYTATAYGCDLTHGYITINTAYS